MIAHRLLIPKRKNNRPSVHGVARFTCLSHHGQVYALLQPLSCAALRGINAVSLLQTWTCKLTVELCL
jgi:hypothetical protein